MRRGVFTAGALTLLLTVASLSGCASTAQPTNPATATNGTDAFALVPGDCFNEPDSHTVERIQTIDCSTPHTYEAYSSITLDDSKSDEFPGTDAITQAADSGCAADFAGFVGVESTASHLAINYFAPDATTWAQLHDRQVLCLVYDPAGKTKGSLLGAKR